MVGGTGGGNLYARELVDVVLAAASGFIVAIEPDGTIVDVRGVLRHELEPCDMIGRKLFGFVEPSWDEPVRAAIARVVGTGQPQHLRVEGHRHDGSATKYLMHIGPIARDGRVVALTLLATDAGESERSERALRDSEQKLRLAVEATGMGVWIWDAATDAVAWDDVLCRHFGLAPERAPADYASYVALIYAPDRDLVVRSVARAVETGVYEDIEHRVQLPGGELRWLLSRGHVEHDADGNVTRLTGGVFDVTDRHRLDDRLRQAQKLQAVGQLAAGVAHNFNNTLTTVLSTLQLLARRAPADLQADVADAIESAQGAAGVVAQLVNLAGRGAPDVRRPVVVDDLVERVARMCRRTFDRSVALDIVPSSDGAAAIVNTSHIEQALLNLCINARDAVVDAAVAEPHIRVTVDSEHVLPPGVRAVGRRSPGRYVAIHVADNGPGIDPVAREHIFEPFFTTKDGDGSGLGLATANAAVVEHDGWLDYDSRPGAGTVFTMHLPACEPAATASVDDAPSAAAAQGSGTVLLVDDEGLVRSAIARLLEDGGFTVLQACNGEQAIEIFQASRDRIDVVLLDHSMPGLSGREVLARMLELDPEARVVMFTGYVPSGGQYPGATAVLTKPADEHQLFSTLREAAAQLH